MSYMYLGSPYSHHDPAVRHMRYRAAGRATAHLIRQGVCVYSPIVHCHEIAREFGLPKDFDFWKEYNFKMLEPADFLLILKLDGWKESKGLEGEMGFAQRKGIPIDFMDWPIDP